MKCPCCGAPDSRVLDSRPASEGASIKRRRECPACGKRFTTYETVDTVPLVVLKKDGTHEHFDERKLLGGIARACEKRPIDPNAIAAEIASELTNSLATEITTREIGERVMEKLREKDEVAYVRFASVYREFRDVDTFMEELKTMIRSRKRSKGKSGGDEA